MGSVLVRLRNPTRTETVPGPLLVSVLLERLAINRESVLVIRNRELIPGDTMLDDDDEVEVRPVISGGAS
jgi:sulfur carrier protein ThiS